MTQQDVNLLEPDTIVIIQDQKQKQDIGLVMMEEIWSKGRQLMTTRYRSTWHLKRS